MAIKYNYGAAPTYVKIASQTLTSTAASITFSNIPQGYTDLVVVGCYKASVAIRMQFNGDTGSTYSYARLGGNGTAVYGDRGGSSADMYVGLSDNTNFDTNIFHIMNYSNSNVYKSVLGRTSVSGNSAQATTGLWRNTAPITSFLIAGSSAVFAIGSSVTLYGIKAAFVPKATGGDIVVQDGTYWYHAFRTTGTFVPQQSLTADILQIAGGGGGNCDDVQYWAGGGGGAGGISYLASQALTSTTPYTATVGAGGIGNTGQGTAGSNSQFGSLTAAVGGGSTFFTPGVNGGSGAGIQPRYNGTPGTGVSGQGNAGGASVGQNSGSGGGGAGGAGQVQQSNGSNPNGSAGGVGLSTYSSWGAVTGTGQNISGTYWFAGGGGGGGISSYGGTIASAGGNGGGGNGSPGGVGVGGIAGLAATGGGGGGAGGSSGSGGSRGSGNGGSGLVIVRYAV